MVSAGFTDRIIKRNGISVCTYTFDLVDAVRNGSVVSRPGFVVHCLYVRNPNVVADYNFTIRRPESASRENTQRGWYETDPFVLYASVNVVDFGRQNGETQWGGKQPLWNRLFFGNRRTEVPPPR